MNIERLRKIIAYSDKNHDEIYSMIKRFCSFAGIEYDSDLLNVLQIVRSSFQKKGFLVLEIPFADDEIGALCYKGDGLGYVVINTSLPKVNTNFAIAHEIYHVFWGENEFVSKVEFSDDHYYEHEEEYAANLFAGMLLMPEISFRRMYLKFKEESDSNEVDTIIRLMAYYEVPFMAVFYVLGCIIILCMNYDYIIPALATICKLAFTPGAAAGGLVGTGIRYAIQYGVARGLFSNESGLGSAPIAAAAAQTRNPVRQALVSSTGTFWDTVVVCALTGLVLVTTIMKNPTINANEVSDGGVLTSLAFGQIPYLGPIILTLGMISFAYSTILGWAYYGERCVEYFAGRAGKGVLIVYRILYIAVAAIAPVVALDLVWLIADTLNALMAIPNLIAVLLLSNMIVKETKKYINDLDAKDDTPVPVVKSR